MGRFKAQYVILGFRLELFFLLVEACFEKGSSDYVLFSFSSFEFDQEEIALGSESRTSS